MPRLVNLALALAALANVVLTPTRWLVDPLISPKVAHAMPHFHYFVVVTCINLLAPAAILLMVFCLAGLHRKDQSSIPQVSSYVALGWLAYFGLWFLAAIYIQNPYLFLYLGILGFFLLPVVGILVAVFLGKVISAIYCEFKSFRQAGLVAGGTATPFMRVASVAVALIAASFLILWFSPGSPVQATRLMGSRFEAACQDVGVQFFKKPDAPVHSIAFDGEPANTSLQLREYKLDSAGKIHTWHEHSPRIKGPLQHLALDFTERRHNPGTEGLPKGDRHIFVRFPERKPFYGIDAFTADVLVVRHDPDLKKTDSFLQDDIQTVLTITDRRTGGLLARMTYIADTKNNVACGANRLDLISEAAFLADALTP